MTGKQQGCSRGPKVPKKRQRGNREATGWRRGSEVSEIFFVAIQDNEQSSPVFLVSLDQFIRRRVLRARPDNDVIHKGAAQSRTGPSRSSIMRWNRVLPFLAPIGTTFHCMGPSGVLISVHGLESSCRSIW